MPETVLQVTDEAGTLLTPLQATFEVDYQFVGDAEPTMVLEGDVQRGLIQADFPEPVRELQFSEVKVRTDSIPGGWDAYAGKTMVFEGRLPSASKGDSIKLPFKGVIPTTTEEKRVAVQSRRVEILNSLLQRYPNNAQQTVPNLPGDIDQALPGNLGEDVPLP
ncbi:MAG: hypothetical protein MK212_20155 [Saprospiraceae bacterium]|nr:hypothetical protein [Saprospiraceae bacterium]